MHFLFLSRFVPLLSSLCSRDLVPEMKLCVLFRQVSHVALRHAETEQIALGVVGIDFVVQLQAADVDHTATMQL